MGLVPLQVFKAVCDGCRGLYDCDGDFVAYFEKAESAAEDLRDADWVVDLSVEPRTVHCPDCALPNVDDDEEGA